MVPIERINSLTNARVKLAVALQRAAERHQRGLALLEGWNLFDEARRSSCEFVEVFVGGGEDGEPLQRVRESLGDSAPIVLVSEPVLNKLATTRAPQPVIAVVRRPPAPSLDELLAESTSSRTPALWCAVWQPNDPGNLGTIARTTEAAGGAALLAITDGDDARGVDPWNPKALRASAGALLRIACIEVQTADLPRITAAGFSVIALDGAGAADFYALPALATSPALLLLGNETHGLPPDAIAAATHHANLPHAGPTESLNVAAAGAAALFEIARQRRERS